MDKFLLAENPMRPESGLWVIHMLAPEAHIQCLEGRQETGNIQQHYVYINSDNVAEEWTLSVYYIAIELTEKEIHHLLDRAWRWYRSYMKWEDNNIDIDEEANEN